MKNIAIVTGASAGLGKEFARQIAALREESEFDVQELWLVARRKQKLEELSEEIKRDYNLEVRVVAVDLSLASDRHKLFELLKEKNPLIRILVNNAGYGDVGNFNQSNKAKQLGMIDLNIRALTEITYECLPFMREGSRILQVASLAAFVAMPAFAVYAATKAYVLNFSLALNEELKSERIVCTALCPGAVKTEFATVATDGNMKQFSKGATASAVVKKALNGLKRGKAIVIPRFWWKLTTMAMSFLPKVWLVKLARKNVK